MDKVLISAPWWNKCKECLVHHRPVVKAPRLHQKCQILALWWTAWAEWWAHKQASNQKLPPVPRSRFLSPELSHHKIKRPRASCSLSRIQSKSWPESHSIRSNTRMARRIKWSETTSPTWISMLHLCCLICSDVVNFYREINRWVKLRAMSYKSFRSLWWIRWRLSRDPSIKLAYSLKVHRLTQRRPKNKNLRRNPNNISREWYSLRLT